MDFSFTDEQLEVAALARRILTDKVSHELLSSLENPGTDRFDRGIYAALAEANLLGIGLPEAAGGSGLGVLAQSLVLQEIGRTVAPVPYLASIAMAADCLATHGTAAQVDALVRPAIDGIIVLTAALAEPMNRDRLSPVTTATLLEDGWHLNGVKSAVPAATIADALLISATKSTGGVGVFVVTPSTPGVTISRQETTSREPYGMIDLVDATVTTDDEVGAGAGDGAEAVRRLVERATVGLCATQLGVCEAAVAQTAEYTKQRVQFDRAIATFQAVGHRMADSYIDTEGIRLTLWQAIATIEAGNDAALDVQTAKFWAAEGGHRVAHAVVHLHGGMGIALEHTIHRYFSLAKQIEFSLGGASEQALRIGATLAATPA